ncbi:MAG: murein transglycosylase A [Hyphomicrobiales bacterium]|nr:murein transglycosylase A [Hyphomicrobiales bacterium]MCP5001346.1 murein transglycosylase A [Hyphomicrobiales bacterium]
MVASLTPVSFQDMPGWNSDNPLKVIEGLVDCAHHARTVKPYKTGAIGIEWSDFLPAIAALENSRPATAGEARAYFETHFVPFGISPDDGADGFVTGYYEPEIAVSADKTGDFQYPFYARPGDLVALNEANHPADMDPYFAFGRHVEGGIVEYADRRTIDGGLLEGRGLEIAWARSKVDVFFVHIQGAARLCYADGRVRRITYAAKTGHHFTAIGRVLVQLGELSAEAVTMQSLRDWLAENPHRVDEILWHNRSYIFFRQADVADLQSGPIAAAKVPLMAGRSLAVDRLLHTFGTPVYVQADSLEHLDDGPFRRLMLAQDTGSAIVGPARGDIFTGSGAVAGDLAGSVKHPAVFYMLVPTTAAERFMP